MLVLGQTSAKSAPETSLVDSPNMESDPMWTLVCTMRYRGQMSLVHCDLRLSTARNRLFSSSDTEYQPRDWQQRGSLK